VLRAKVTITKDQLTDIITTFTEGIWGENWAGLPNSEVGLWLPVEQVTIDEVVADPDCHPFIAL
jgi:hypothetical protein